MIERNITKEDLELLLSGDIDIVKIPSKQDIDIELILGIVCNKNIVLIINKTTKNLITVRNMRDNEKQIYRRNKNEKKH
jgi:hypothetical protein